MSTILQHRFLKAVLNIDDVDPSVKTHTLMNFLLKFVLICFYGRYAASLLALLSTSLSLSSSLSVSYVPSLLTTIRPLIWFLIRFIVIIDIYYVYMYMSSHHWTFVYFMKCDLIEVNISSAVLVRIWSIHSPIWENWSWRATTFRNWWVRGRNGTIVFLSLSWFRLSTLLVWLHIKGF